MYFTCTYCQKKGKNVQNSTSCEIFLQKLKKNFTRRRILQSTAKYGLIEKILYTKWQNPTFGHKQYGINDLKVLHTSKKNLLLHANGSRIVTSCTVRNIVAIFRSITKMKNFMKESSMLCISRIKSHKELIEQKWKLHCQKNRIDFINIQCRWLWNSRFFNYFFITSQFGNIKIQCGGIASVFAFALKNNAAALNETIY